MGLFSSSSSINQTEDYKNAPLDQYTQPYRAYAPWAFATMDPTATLAAMGNGTKLGGTDLGSGFKDYLSGLSSSEKQGAQAANDALARIQQRQTTGQFLTPQETDFINTSLDKAFDYAHTTGVRDWTLATQQLAGSRGLMTSDTPVAAPAMQELRNFDLGLGSQRAQLGMSTTMGFAGQQNQFDESLMEFQKSLQQNAWQTRQGFMFGGGLQGASNIAHTTHTTGTQTSTPSIMSDIMQTTSAVSGLMDLGKRMMPAGQLTGGASSALGSAMSDGSSSGMTGGGFGGFGSNGIYSFPGFGGK